MVAPEFNDITITGVDEARTVVSIPGTAIYDVHLKLSANPPSAWGALFAKAREFPRHSLWRKARVAGSFIIVECPLKELEAYHLRDVKQDVETANTEYRLLIARQAERDAAEKKASTEERASVRDALGKLKF